TTRRSFTPDAHAQAMPHLQTSTPQSRHVPCSFYKFSLRSQASRPQLRHRTAAKMATRPAHQDPG
ncbi:hypothetical protein OG21DRAFT_1513313, partial [Imleria badia]